MISQASTFFCWGGVDIVNAARSAAYLENAPMGNIELATCSTCPDDLLELLDEEYCCPADDGAPWVDVDVPASANFLGFIPFDVEIGESYSRQFFDSANGGVIAGTPRIGGRDILFRGVLAATSECSARYGLKWLRGLMTNCDASACGSGCLIDQPGEFLSCCGCGLEEQDFLEFPNVVPRSLPQVLQEFDGGGSCGPNCNGGCEGAGFAIEVEFVLTATDGRAFTAPEQLFFDESNPALWEPFLCTNECCFNCPVECGSTLDAPSPCGTHGTVEPLPTFASGCACVPVFIYQGPCYSLDLGTDAFPIFKLQSRGDEVRGIEIKLQSNPLGLDCCEMCECDDCAWMVVSVLPAGATLTMDARTGRSTMVMPGGSSFDASGYVFDGRTGGAFDVSNWPSGQMCFHSSISAVSRCADLWMQLELSRGEL